MMNNITNSTEEMVKSYMELVGRNSMSPAEYLDFRKQTVMELSSGYLREDIILTSQSVIPTNRNTEEIKPIVIEETPVKEEKKVAGFTPTTPIIATETPIKNKERTETTSASKTVVTPKNNFAFEKEEQNEDDDFFAIINKLKC